MEILVSNTAGDFGLSVTGLVVSFNGVAQASEHDITLSYDGQHKGTVFYPMIETFLEQCEALNIEVK